MIATSDDGGELTVESDSCGMLPALDKAHTHEVLNHRYGGGGEG